MYSADDYDAKDFVVLPKNGNPHLPKHADLRRFCQEVPDIKKKQARSCMSQVVLSALETMMNISVARNDLSKFVRRITKLYGGFNERSLTFSKDNPSYRSILKILSHEGCHYHLGSNMAKYHINEYARLDSSGHYMNKKESSDNGKKMSNYQFIRLMKTIIASGVPIIGSVRFPDRMNRRDIVGTGILDYHNKRHNRYKKLKNLIYGVLFVGYDDNLEMNNKKGYFIFQNSWGYRWGDKGFGYIHYKEIRKSLDFWIISSFDFDCLESDGYTQLYYNTDDPNCLFKVSPRPSTESK